MLRNWNEKLGAKFPSTTLGYSLVRIFGLDDGFSEIPKLEASPEDGKELQQKDKKGQGHFLEILLSAHARAKMS